MAKTLKFRPELIPLVLSGEKNSTWRLFDEKDLQKGDEVSLLNWETKEKFADAVIISVKEKKLGEINDSDFDGHEEYERSEKLVEAFKNYYGNKVSSDTSVKIIKFQLNL